MTAIAAPLPKQRRVIMCSGQHWDSSIRLSAHHLATAFADHGWQVCFLSGPTSVLHRLAHRRDLATRQRFANWWGGGQYDLGRRIFYYSPLALLPPSRLRPFDGDWLLNNWMRYTWPALDTFGAAPGCRRG